MRRPKIAPRNKFLEEMKSKMEKSLVVDLFTLVGLVLKDRIGSVRLHDKLFDDMIRWKHLHIFVFSMVGVICTIVTSSIMIEDDPDVREIILNEVAFENTNLKSELIVLQVILSLSSVTSCILIVQKYMLIVYEKRRQWSGFSTYDLVQHGANNPDMIKKFEESYSFSKSGLRWNFLIEFMMHLIHPIINFNNSDTRILYIILQCFVFLRLYLGIQVVFLFSQEFKSRFDIVSSNLELQRTGFQVKVPSTMKTLFFKYPMLFTGIISGCALLPIGFIIFLLENGSQPEVRGGFGRLASAYWFTVVTFMTLGYGDLVVQSVLGRLAAVLCAATGITITTILGGVVTNLMVQSKEQRHVTEYLVTIDSTRGCRHAAARLIQSAWRFYRRRKGDIMTKWDGNGHKSNTVYRAILNFRNFRWELSQSQSTANDPVIDAKINHVSHTLSQSVLLLQKHADGMTNTFDELQTFVNDMDKILQ